MADEKPQVTAGTSTGWEEEKKRLEAQIASLNGSVQGLTKFKQKAEAYDRLAVEAGDAIRFDPATGLPLSWNVDDQPSSYAPVVNPLSELGVDDAKANAWLQAQTQAILSQQGYVTQSQAQALANQAALQAYQAANQRFLTQRSVDKLLSNPIYKDLGDPNSDWAKRTAAYLQKYQAGQPMRDGAGWDEWNYTAPQVLQQAADISWVQMEREKAASQTSQQQAIQNQQQANLSGAFPGVSTQPNPVDQFDKIVAEGGDPSVLLKELVNRDQAARQSAP